MRKRDQRFQKILEYKRRFSKLPNERLILLLSGPPLIKEAAIAAREVLEERGVRQARREGAKP